MFWFVVFAIGALIVAELYVIVAVAGAIGVLNTIGLLLLCSIVGAWLTKRVGVSVLTRLRRQIDAGQMPTNELIDAALVLGGGLFLLVPGFVSDGIGLLLLFPPTRAVARSRVRRRLRVRYVTIGRPLESGPDVIDV